MLVFRGLGELPPEQDPVALTIGNFDGVHLGHRAIVDRLAAQASAVGASPTVLTFDPHPQAVLRGHAPLALVTAERKLELLEEAGVARVVVLPFDRPLSLVEPESFVKDVLVGELGVRAVVVGTNFRFGHKARGDIAMLASMGETLGFSFEAVPMSELDGRRLSSTEIRNAIGACDLAWSNRALCLAWLGHNAEAISCLDRVVELRCGTTFDEAVDAWALAEVLRQGAGAEPLADDLRFVWLLDWSEEDTARWLEQVPGLRAMPAPGAASACAG